MCGCVGVWLLQRVGDGGSAARVMLGSDVNVMKMGDLVSASMVR
jgi:hypothetical protein